ncbi:hypothetical protein M9Y10_020496 [Tritrichomonas musculus]|uniref:Uncharacterized protein n=1 Tax=Tritrichomonas musculus TaxID=1915356 RepID=A0ABR2HGF3_9EUKA
MKCYYHEEKIPQRIQGRPLKSNKPHFHHKYFDNSIKGPPAPAHQEILDLRDFLFRTHNFENIRLDKLLKLHDHLQYYSKYFMQQKQYVNARKFIYLQEEVEAEILSQSIQYKNFADEMETKSQFRQKSYESYSNAESIFFKFDLETDKKIEEMNAKAADTINQFEINWKGQKNIDPYIYFNNGKASGDYQRARSHLIKSLNIDKKLYRESRHRKRDEIARLIKMGYKVDDEGNIIFTIDQENESKKQLPHISANKQRAPRKKFFSANKSMTCDVKNSQSESNNSDVSFEPTDKRKNDSLIRTKNEENKQNSSDNSKPKRKIVIKAEKVTNKTKSDLISIGTMTSESTAGLNDLQPLADLSDQCNSSRSDRSASQAGRGRVVKRKVISGISASKITKSSEKVDKNAEISSEKTHQISEIDKENNKQNSANSDNRNMEEKVDNDANSDNRNMEEKADNDANSDNRNMGEKADNDANSDNRNMEEKADNDANSDNRNMEEKVNNDANSDNRNMEEKADNDANFGNVSEDGKKNEVETENKNFEENGASSGNVSEDGKKTGREDAGENASENEGIQSDGRINNENCEDEKHLSNQQQAKEMENSGESQKASCSDASEKTEKHGNESEKSDKPNEHGNVSKGESHHHSDSSGGKSMVRPSDISIEFVDDFSDSKEKVDSNSPLNSPNKKEEKGSSSSCSLSSSIDTTEKRKLDESTELKRAKKDENDIDFDCDVMSSLEEIERRKSEESENLSQAKCELKNDDVNDRRDVLKSSDLSDFEDESEVTNLSSDMMSSSETIEKRKSAESESLLHAQNETELKGLNRKDAQLPSGDESSSPGVIEKRKSDESDALRSAQKEEETKIENERKQSENQEEKSSANSASNSPRILALAEKEGTSSSLDNEKESVDNEKESVDNEKESVDNEKESVDNEKESVDNEKESVDNEKESVDNEKESVDNEKESVDNEKESVDNEKESVDNEKESVDNEKESVDNEKELNDNEKELNDNEKELNDNEKESVNNEKESVDNEKESVDNEKESVDNEKESVDNEKESVDNEKESVDNEKESVDNEKESVDNEKESVDNEKKDKNPINEQIQRDDILHMSSEENIYSSGETEKRKTDESDQLNLALEEEKESESQNNQKADLKSRNNKKSEIQDDSENRQSILTSSEANFSSAGAIEKRKSEESDSLKGAQNDEKDAKFEVHKHEDEQAKDDEQISEGNSPRILALAEKEDSTSSTEIEDASSITKKDDDNSDNSDKEGLLLDSIPSGTENQLLSSSDDLIVYSKSNSQFPVQFIFEDDEDEIDQIKIDKKISLFFSEEEDDE